MGTLQVPEPNPRPSSRIACGNFERERKCDQLKKLLVQYVQCEIGNSCESRTADIDNQAFFTHQ
eukprot:2423786-Amphidinium_carterae.1